MSVELPCRYSHLVAYYLISSYIGKTDERKYKHSTIKKTSMFFNRVIVTWIANETGNEEKMKRADCVAITDAILRQNKTVLQARR